MHWEQGRQDGGNTEWETRVQESHSSKRQLWVKTEFKREGRKTQGTGSAKYLERERTEGEAVATESNWDAHVEGGIEGQANNFIYTRPL